MPRALAPDFEAEGRAYRLIELGTKPVTSLSVAEAHVAALTIAGKTAAQIAKLRGTSKRTVQHQLESVYRKLRISGGAALARTLARVR